MIDYKETVRTALQGQIQNDPNHGWGAKDSIAAIRAVFTKYLQDEVGLKEMSSEEVAALDLAIATIGEFVNPSQFRQKLEGLKEGHPLRLNKGEKRATGKSLVADL